MFQLLSQYFFQVKKLYIPAVGTFLLEPYSAVNDFTSQTVQAPGWTTVFTPVKEGAVAENSQQNEGLFDWLADKLNVSKEDAIIKYDEFSDKVKSDLDNGLQINWDGVGVLERVNNRLVFSPELATANVFTGVSAKKIVRENASHNVLVGERETTTGEMRTELTEQKPVGTRSNKIGWILLLVALILLVWFFLSNGCNLKNTGNQQKVEVQTSGETYRLR